MTFKFDESKYYYDPEAAERPIIFIERYCTHTAGELYGEGIVLLDWQKNLVREIFGVLKKSNGKRKHRYVYLEVPKKNGKSLLISGLGLYLTMADGEKGAEVFACAGDKIQARIVFDASKTMVENNEFLSDRLIAHRDQIKYEKSGSKLTVLSSEAKTKHGHNIHGILFDELHVQPDAELYDTLTKGIASRSQPLVLMITTAGVVETWAETIHDYALGIQSGKFIDNKWLVRIYAAEEDPDDPLFYEREEVFAECNPSYPISPTREYFEGEIEELRNRPMGLNAFFRLHLNIWTGSQYAWINDAKWQTCDLGKVDIKALKGRKCFGGVDLGVKSDLSSVSWLFPPEDRGEPFIWIVNFWCPDDKIRERDKRENAKFGQWVKAGLITTCPGDTMENKYVEEYIKDCCELFDVEHIGYDKYKATELVIQLTNEGIPMSPVAQGAQAMTSALTTVEDWIMEGELNHTGNPVLRWQAGNVVIKEMTNGGRVPQKKNKHSKIDGVSSFLTAVSVYLADFANNEKESVYESQDIRVI